MTARTHTPRRLRGWTPPQIGDRLKRREDGKVFSCVMVFRADGQVRLESCTDTERAFPFASQLKTEWEAMGS